MKELNNIKEMLINVMLSPKECDNRSLLYQMGDELGILEDCKWIVSIIRSNQRSDKSVVESLKKEHKELVEKIPIFLNGDISERKALIELVDRIREIEDLLYVKAKFHQPK